MKPGPEATPLREWSDGWLKMETAYILNHLGPAYLTAPDAVKRKRGWPVTRDDMIAFIKRRGEFA